MYDIIFIGGGLNYAGAIVAAREGLKVALIEKDLEHIGGTCLNNGCIPSKNLLHKSKAILEVGGKLDLEKLVKDKNEKIAKMHRAIETQLKAANVEIIEGKGYVVDDGVEVNKKILKSKYIVIGTGSHPHIPDGIEVDKKRVITSDEALNLTSFPKNIAIYGSGAIGLEMASFFAANGVETTLIYRHSTISKRIDSEIAKNIEKMLTKIGVKLKSNYSINTAISKNDKVIVNDELEFDMLLVATGRKANIDVVKTNKIKISKGIETDEYFETSMKNVFAIGDCNGKLLLAHAARAEVLNVVDTILNKKRRLNLDNIPKFIYTIPLSYASIGIKSSKTATFELSHLGISKFDYLAELGLVKIYFDDENFITGAEILSPNAEEIISIISTALAAELDKDTLLKAVFPHPTYSESIDRVLRRAK